MKTNSKSRTRPRLMTVTGVPPETHAAKSKLLEVAAELFATKGLDGTSTRDIARTSGLNVSLISYYFGGKDGLYLEVLRHFATEIDKQIGAVVTRFDQSVLNEAALRKAVMELVDSFIELRLRYPHAGTLLAREKMSGMPNTKELHQHMLRAVGERVESLVIKGQKAGFVNKKINPHMFMFCLAESIVGYFVHHDSPTLGSDMQKRCFKLPRDKNHFRDQICLIYLEGILK